MTEQRQRPLFYFYLSRFFSMSRSRNFQRVRPCLGVSGVCASHAGMHWLLHPPGREQGAGVGGSSRASSGQAARPLVAPRRCESLRQPGPGRRPPCGPPSERTPRCVNLAAFRGPEWPDGVEAPDILAVPMGETRQGRLPGKTAPGGTVCTAPSLVCSWGPRGF